MAKRLMRAFKLVVSVLFLLLPLSCTLSIENKEHRKAQRSLNNSDYEAALFHFSRVLRKSPESDLALDSARTAARVAALHQMDFLRAVEFYRHIVIYSQNADERRQAQRQIASIEFENLNNYEQAIIEYNRLLKLPHSEAEAYDYRLAVARSYFRLNNFIQALVEVEEILGYELNDDQVFEATLLKGNLKLTTKQLDAAIGIFSDLQEQFPERARRENLGLNVAVTYEEMEDFAMAISVLETIKNDYPTPEFIELKIKRLQERQANLPGARGPVR